MRPGWHKTGVQVWRWGDTPGRGDGPWLEVYDACRGRYDWSRTFIGPDGRRHCRTGDCDDLATAMACAEVRHGRPDCSPLAAGQARVREGIGGRWVVEGYCDSEEFGDLWVDIADDCGTPAEATLAAARILLGGTDE